MKLLSFMSKATVMVGFALSVITTTQAHDAEYTFVQIDFPSIAHGTLAFGINNSGAIVGTFSPSGPEQSHGFLIPNMANRGIIAVDVPQNLSQSPPEFSTRLNAINDRDGIPGFYTGQIVGTFFTDIVSQVVHGFLLKKGKFTEIVTFEPPPPKGNGSTAVRDINNAMKIVGDSAGRGFILDLVKHRLTEIHLPTDFGELRGLHGINNSGQITGDFVDATGQHGFISNPPYEVFTKIDVPSSLEGFFPATPEERGSDAGLRGINDAGHITGTFQRNDDSLGMGHGLLCIPPYRNGDCKQIDVPGAYLTQLQKINNSGQIVGDFGVLDVHGKGLRHGLLATPIGPIINNDVEIEPNPASFSTTSSTLDYCPAGTVGTFFFNATLTNISNSKLTNLIVEVTNLNGNLLANADIRADQRVFVTVGSPLDPGQLVFVPFTICLEDLEDFDPFSLVMDVLGTVQ